MPSSELSPTAGDYSPSQWGFPEASYEAWKQEVLRTLGTADIASLVSATRDGIPVEPLYSADHATVTNSRPQLAGRADNRWKVAQCVHAAHPEVAAQQIEHELSRGADIAALHPAFLPHEPGVALPSFLHLSKMLPAGAEVLVEGALEPLGWLTALGEQPCIIIADPFDRALHYGGLPFSWDTATALQGAALRTAGPGQRVIAAGARTAANAGASAVERVAFAVASLYATARALPAELRSTLPAHLVIDFPVGTAFFEEIAAVRALRLLVSAALAAAGIDSQEQPHFHLSGIRYNKTTTDPWVNILRSSVEVAAAAIGGASSVEVDPLDATWQPSGDFSRRIARNTQLVLREETQLDHVVDPAAGSFFVETLTAQIADAAWKRVQEIEDAGGLVEALRSGDIAQRVLRQHEAERSAVQHRKQVVVGTTTYALPTETLPEATEQQAPPPVPYTELPKQPFHEDTFRQHVLAGHSPQSVYSSFLPVSVPALIPVRRSEDYEQLRRRSEQHRTTTGTPAVALTCFGPLKDYKARLDFTTGVLDAGGIAYVVVEVLDKTPEEVADILRDNHVPVVLLCGSDAAYEQEIATRIPALVALLAGRTVGIAGKPKHLADAIAEAGIAPVLTAGANIVAFLQSVQSAVETYS